MDSRDHRSPIAISSDKSLRRQVAMSSKNRERRVAKREITSGDLKQGQVCAHKPFELGQSHGDWTHLSVPAYLAAPSFPDSSFLAVSNAVNVPHARVPFLHVNTIMRDAAASPPMIGSSVMIYRSEANPCPLRGGSVKRSRLCWMPSPFH